MDEDRLILDEMIDIYFMLAHKNENEIVPSRIIMIRVVDRG
jgi:hypothetical protein